ncbi:helix-turn-helix domain-containing protein [Nocardia sp. NPDC057030]|uniref:helix-turn-helix domain-containing protein n=1 Tax=unclassified Nocardia TaxID=2637762 RepID=UPI003639E43F
MGTQSGQGNSAAPACGRCDRVKPPLRRGLCGACYERARERNKAYGRWDPDRAPAEPVREHVARLREAGLSHRRLVELAGLHRSVLGHLLRGGAESPLPQWVSHATAERILAVPVPESALEVAADGAPVPLVGAQRRLRALVADGWPQARLARELGMRPSNMGPLMHGDRPITAGRYRDVVELFARMQLTPGPSQRARDYGRAHRWARSWQWDEDAIDDPAARPQPNYHQRKNKPRPDLGWAVHASTPAAPPACDGYAVDELAVPVRRRIERTR